MMFLHGGPEGQGRPGYNEFFPPLLEAGVTVFLPNVRGSGGFGRTFMHADDRDRRFAAIDDVADAALFLVDRGLAQADRIACCGWSYGGYLTQAALTFHPQLFAAGISICGMSDLNTWYRNTEPWIAAAAYSKYGHPVGDRELLDQLSPLLRAHALTTPLLLVHGLNDTNVPPSESQQMYDALRARAAPSSNCCSRTTVMRSTNARIGPCWSKRCAIGSPRRSHRAALLNDSESRLIRLTKLATG